MKMPNGGVHVHKAISCNDHVPKPDGETTFDEEVDACFLFSFAKRA